MAAELQTNAGSGLTIYALVRSSTGTIWNGSALQAYVTGDYALFKIAATEQGSASGYYTATFPSSLTAGAYNITWKQQSGGSPAESDTTIAVQSFQWNGSAENVDSAAATSGQVGTYLPLRMYRGGMVQNFPFKLVSSADHVTPFTSGVVSGMISRDGGAFAVLQSGTAVAGYSELGRGFYCCTLTSGDLLCNTAALSFTAVGVSGGSADQRDFGIVLQRTSGATVT